MLELETLRREAAVLQAAVHDVGWSTDGDEKAMNEARADAQKAQRRYEEALNRAPRASREAHFEQTSWSPTTQKLRKKTYFT